MPYKKFHLMTRVMVRRLCCCISLLAYSACGAPKPVLMLGDSYMSANNGLNTILTKLLQSAGDKREVAAITTGGKDLAWHAKQVNVSGSAHEAALGSRGREWGLVVLQDQSHVPAFCCNGPDTDYYSSFTASLAAVQNLDHAAEEHGARTVFLQTWGRRNGAPEPFLGSFERMNELVIRGYDMYANKISRNDRKPLTVPVGVAFSRIYNELAASQPAQELLSTDNLWRQLYSADGSHPSIAGSYLAACLLFATITKKSPIGLVGYPGVTSAQVTALQQHAHEAFFVNVTAVNELKEMEGRYSSKDPDVNGFVAEIRAGVVVWPEGIRTPLKRHGSKLDMFFHGKQYSGSFSNGVITWTDGDVWKRAVGTQQVATVTLPEKLKRGLARREIGVSPHVLDTSA